MVFSKGKNLIKKEKEYPLSNVRQIQACLGYANHDIIKQIQACPDSSDTRDFIQKPTKSSTLTPTVRPRPVTFGENIFLLFFAEKYPFREFFGIFRNFVKPRSAKVMQIS